MRDRWLIRTGRGKTASLERKEEELPKLFSDSDNLKGTSIHFMSLMMRNYGNIRSNIT